MSEYAIITQNDNSEWKDIKGDVYHYPKSYKSILTPGRKIIYYKGAIKDSAYASKRMSPYPHYFGFGIIGESIMDPQSAKGDRYCEILGYQEFHKAVLAKSDNQFLEEIPESRKANYWRFAVREVTRNVHERILSHADLKDYEIGLPSIQDEFESHGPLEGEKKTRFTTYYERNPFYRNKALEIHGYDCMACGFNFEKTYGEQGKGFIHVHHVKPVSESRATIIDPEADMVVLCPNCHAIVHRKKKVTLSLDQLLHLLK
jgi:predicted HNH restriction endonuclease